MFLRSNVASRSAIPLVLAVAAGLTLSTAAAQQTSSRMKGLELSNDKPIQIQSNQLQIRDQENLAEFTGDVKVVQGTTTLQAGRMVVYYQSNGGSVSGGNANIEKIDVFDRVYLKSGTQEATADNGSFNLVSQTFILKGKKVVLSEGKNVFVGCQLTVQMQTGEAKLDACGGRVTIQLDPKSRKQN